MDSSSQPYISIEDPAGCSRWDRWMHVPHQNSVSLVASTRSLLWITVAWEVANLIMVVTATIHSGSELSYADMWHGAHALLGVVVLLRLLYFLPRSLSRMARQVPPVELEGLNMLCCAVMVCCLVGIAWDAASCIMGRWRCTLTEITAIGADVVSFALWAQIGMLTT